MLVLTRKLNEAIQIGNEIEVKVVGIEGDQIKLGITAPNHIEIHRKEIYLDIQQANSQATENQVDLIKFLKEK